MHQKTIIVSVSIIVSFILGFFVGMEFKAYQLRQTLSEVSNIFSNDFDSEPLNKEESVFINKEVGQEVALATISFTVNSVKEETSLSGGFGTPTVAGQGAKFVIIDMTVANTTNSSYSFFPEGFILIDDQEREFDAYADTIGNIENYLDVRNLAPSIPETGFIVYEVPENAINYNLVIGKAGTNEIYQIKLR
ncbi:MAG TPA: DUF4352 domain-containing protein [Candidatus Peribacteraceae bacterium]|nr:DUF4352 domain-containing protein [Candidatus Peribacteraceae bacterium]